MRVENDVLAVLSSALVSGNKVTLTGQLDRKLYMQTDKVLQAAGGKWDRKAKAHVFSDDAETRIEQIILTGDVVVPKDEYNFFPTPPDLVRRLIHAAGIQDGMMVLEPSAGQGAIAKAAHEAAGRVKVDMVELMPENVTALLNLKMNKSDVMGPVDFLTVEPKPIYDRVVMNPPFMRQADVKHVNHALKFLKPGGLLVSIMSSGIVFRQNSLSSNFRDTVSERGGHIEPLPNGSFKESGTMVNTVMVTIPG